ncbi:MAG: hypothetical protein ACI8UO_003493 [Verrucomicrobiales bacterium]|jgi:hypothetical protein
MRPPTDRERLLLIVCVIVLFTMANLVVGNFVLGVRSASKEKFEVAQAENEEQQKWLTRGAEWVDRNQWLDENLPAMASSSRAGAQLIGELQEEAYERELRLPRTSILESRTTAFYQEVSVQVNIEGDLVEATDWLTTMQDPKTFTVVKYLEIELDTKSKEKEPQAKCNLVLARWFALKGQGVVVETPEEPGPETEPDPDADPEANPETQPEPTPEPETETPSPDDPSSKLTVSP